jgi:glycosyltransferase involved in cell wall biosynthesis
MNNDIKKILYLSYTGMTDPLGQSQVLSYLRGLSKTGNYQFTIISFEKEQAYKQLRQTVADLCSAAGIKWYPLSYTSKPPVVSTFRDVHRMQKLAVQLSQEHHFSLVHCRSYIPSLVGLHLKKKFRIPFLFDMRGFWADERLDGGIWKREHPLYRLIYRYFKRKEKKFLLQADHVVSLTQNAKDEILSWKHTLAPLHITVIPCCVDLTLFDSKKVLTSEQQKVLSILDIPQGAHVISYIGSLGTWYMLEEMLLFIKQYQQVIPHTYFMVLTGEPPQMVLEAAEKVGVDTNTIRIKKVPRPEVPLYISLSSLSIFFIKPAFSKKASSPVKQGELMAMGIPVICNNAVGDTEEIVEKYRAGVIVKQFTPEAFSQAIEKLEHTSFNSEQIIKGAVAFYSLERGVELYRQVYQSIAHG